VLAPKRIFGHLSSTILLQVDRNEIPDEEEALEEEHRY
jgi:hypothetical protein